MTTSYRRPAAPAVAGNSKDAFPSLPPAAKPLTTIFGYGTGAVRRDVGGRNTGFSWGSTSTNSAAAGSSTAGGPGGSADAENETGGKGKKKKKKQILAQWG